MNKIYYTFLLICISTSLSSQINVESLMTRRYLSCQDIYYNAQYLIPEYYASGKTDTLIQILKFWEDHCGISEPLMRYKILISIQQKTFSENLYDAYIIEYLRLYKQEVTRTSNNKLNRYYWNYAINQSYNDKFSVTLARSLLHREGLSKIEIFFLQFYSNEFLDEFEILKSDDYKETKLQLYYNQEIASIQKVTNMHADFIIGAWIPQSKLHILGNHPFIGFRTGFQSQKWIYDLTLGFKFVNSPNTYKVEKNDSIWNTDHFFGGYFGLDAGYELIKAGKSHFSLISGIAFDGFDALDKTGTNSNESISKSINSLNLNIGLGYKYYFRDWRYLGIELKYNFVNYPNPYGTDLTGNAITLNLIYGFFGNRYGNSRLKELNYFK